MLSTLHIYHSDDIDPVALEGMIKGVVRTVDPVSSVELLSPKGSPALLENPLVRGEIRRLVREDRDAIVAALNDVISNIEDLP